MASGIEHLKTGALAIAQGNGHRFAPAPWVTAARQPPAAIALCLLCGNSVCVVSLDNGASYAVTGSTLSVSCGIRP